MDPANSHRSRPGNRRFAVVSGYARRPLTPRGQRTQWLQRRLEREWEVETIAFSGEPSPAANGTSAGARAGLRRAAGVAVRSTLLDKWEPWSLRRLGRWGADVAGALLIAYPWSPVAYAARRLRRVGVPYIVDAGDPWALTSPSTDTHFLARLRCSRAEQAIWAGAAGAVVTTRQQAATLARLFPELPSLVRPNGYEPPPALSPPKPGRGDPEHLRLAHYGMLIPLRVEVGPLLEALVASGRWRTITFTQFGEDHAGMLARAPVGVEVEYRPAQPWPEVLAGAHEFDLAVVVGNWLTGQLPSKAIQYMTLPIPRLALTERREDDALAEYVSGRPGWLALQADAADAAARVDAHLARGWSSEELAPPPEEAWPAVAEQIAEFAECRIGERAA